MGIVPADNLGIDQKRHQQTLKGLEEARAAQMRVSEAAQECVSAVADTVTLSFEYPNATSMPDGSPKKFDFGLIGGRSSNILEAFVRMIKAIFKEPNRSSYGGNPAQSETTGQKGEGSAAPLEI